MKGTPFGVEEEVAFENPFAVDASALNENLRGNQGAQPSWLDNPFAGGENLFNAPQ